MNDPMEQLLTRLERLQQSHEAAAKTAVDAHAAAAADVRAQGATMLDAINSRADAHRENLSEQVRKAIVSGNLTDWLRMTWMAIAVFSVLGAAVALIADNTGGVRIGPEAPAAQVCVSDVHTNTDGRYYCWTTPPKPPPE